jgi:hypothetical protein
MLVDAMAAPAPSTSRIRLAMRQRLPDNEQPPLTDLEAADGDLLAWWPPPPRAPSSTSFCPNAGVAKRPGYTPGGGRQRQA